MSEPYVGEIRLFAGSFAPRGWALCDGQLLSVSSNDALFSLFGTIYGGDGRTTFGLPDMRGRIPVHQGTGPGLSNRRLGSKGGAETVTLTENQLPAHAHATGSGNAATSADPSSKVMGTTGRQFYGAAAGATPGSTASAPQVSQIVGANQAHANVMPFQCVNFIICISGLFPPRN
jgi:microcystin-dependent protein